MCVGGGGGGGGVFTCFPSAMRSSSFIIKLSESTVPPAKEPKNPLEEDIPDSDRRKRVLHMV